MLDRVGLDRAIGKRASLFDFVPVIWPQVEQGEYFSNWHIGAVCEHLEAVSLGYIKRLVVNIPPGSMKSRLTGLIWPVWHWLTFPTERFMFTSFDISLTHKQASDALMVTSSDWWKDRFGDLYFTDGNQAVGEYENSRGGYRIATSFGSKATGKHVHIQVADDPTKPKEATKENLEKTTELWKGTYSTRQASGAPFRRVIVMQRLHDLDLSGYAEAEGYEVLRLPMRYEKAFSCSTSLGSVDKRTQDGALLWPERFPEDSVKTLEKELGAYAPAQLQQRPVPEGGSIFHRDWLLKLWDTKSLPARNYTLIQSWDCTFKDEDANDYVCGQVWMRAGPYFYLLDCVNEHMSFIATVAAIKTMTTKWPKTKTIYIEDKANGSAVIEVLKKEIPRVEAVNPEGGKIARANAISGLFSGGNVFLPDAPWLEDYRQQMTRFPKGAHDDMVDATSQALAQLFDKPKDLAGAMKAWEQLENQADPKTKFNPWM